MEATADTEPLVVEEVISLESLKKENKVERAEFAFVVFHNLAETYPEDADLRFQYTLTADLVPTTRDWVGLYKVGWMSPRDYLYYEWATVPPGYRVGNDADASVTFPAGKLPKDDGEFYQLCYVSSSAQIRGASTPFQFRRPGCEEYIELEDDETNMLVIRSKTAFLEESLQKAETKRLKLTETIEGLQKERDEIAGKHKELLIVFTAKEFSNKDLTNQVGTLKGRVAQMNQEAKDMIMVRDELQNKIDKMKEDQSNLDKTIGQFTSRLNRTTKRLKELEAERDELCGKNANLQEEVSMYKHQFANSETAMKSFTSQSEELQIKLAQQESLIDHLKQTVDSLNKELEENRQNLEQQTNVHRNEVGDLEEKLRNAEDKLSAAEDSKMILMKEIACYQETQQELSRQIEKSRSECDSVKHKLCVLEEDFTQKNKILEKEMDQTRQDLLNSIQEKEKLQGENSTLSQKLSLAPEVNVSSMSVMKQSLNQIKERLEKKEKHCKSLEKSLMTREHDYLQAERDLKREIEDLKEKILMCSVEYKNIFIERNKLQKKVDKMSKRKSKLEKQSEVIVESETQLMTSTPLTCETPLEEEENAKIEPLKQEIDRQVEDFGRELEQGLAKKMKYKCLYKQEKERNSLLQQNYEEEMKEKENEIKRLKQKVKELPSTYDLKVRALEKCVEEKQQEIEQLNMKLRQCNQSRNDEAGASNVPPRYSAVMNESKYPYPMCSPSYSAPFLVYPQQAPLHYPHPEPHMATSAQIPYAMPLTPLQYPPHNRNGQLPDRVPVQRDQTLTDKVTEQSENGDYLGTEGQVEDSLGKPLTPLPAPLEPVRLPSAKVAAVKSSIGKDEIEGAPLSDFISETNLKVALPRGPAGIPSAPPATLMDKEDRFYDAEGASMKHCTYCQQTFSVEVDDDTFQEHQLSHVIGQICPFCKMEKAEDMTDEHFSQHVNNHMDNNNNNNNEADDFV